MLEQRTREVAGVPVRYHVAGEGPPAVLVHGLAGSWRWWEPVVEPLAERFRLLLVDLPGFGTARGRRFVLSEAPAYVRALMREVGIERATLVGHSLGGAVAARLAAASPDAVDRLVLAAPAGVLERRRIAAYALPLLATLRHAKPRFLRILASDALRAGASTLFRAGRELLRDEALPHQLGAIRAPTLLVWGDRDPLVPVNLAKEYCGAIPDARLVVVHGAGHVPMADRPAEFAETVVGFAGGDARRPA